MAIISDCYFLKTIYINKYMPTAYQKDGSIFKKLQELFKNLKVFLMKNYRPFSSQKSKN